MILMELSLLVGNNSSVQVSHDSNSNSPNEEDEHANGSARTRSKDLSATQRQQTIIPHEHIAKVLLLVAFEEGGHHNLVKADEDVMVHWIDARKHLVQARLHLRGELHARSPLHPWSLVRGHLHARSSLRIHLHARSPLRGHVLHGIFVLRVGGENLTLAVDVEASTSDSPSPHNNPASFPF